MALIPNNKISATDRVLVLEVMEGERALSSTGLVDTRLFTGENKLHAVLDHSSMLWHLKYDDGIVPQPLKQQFTGFGALYKFCEDYFKKRNIKIKEVIH
jgi:hypothetical protein